MSRFSLCCAALIAGLVIVGSLSAQGRRGGGFGGGLGGSPLVLVANEAVQKEIGITDDQKAKLTTLREEFQKDMEAARSTAGIPTGRDAFANLSDEERTKLFAKIAEVTKTLSEKYSPKLKESLKPEQYERLQQISYQAAGPAAYADPEVVKALDLTKEQQEKIAAVNKDFGEKQRAIFAGGAAGGREAFTKLRDEHNAELAKVLTKEQSEKFTKLKGKEFDLASLRAGGPGGAKRGEKKVD